MTQKRQIFVFLITISILLVIFETVAGITPSGEKTWTNVEGNVKVTPEAIFRPKTLADLQDIVNQARNNGKKIRCAAQGHSWSSLSVTKGYLVIVNDLATVQVKNHSKYGWVAIAEAGVSIKDVDDALRFNNPPLTLDSGTVSNNFRVSGVTATGSHGAKFSSGIVSDQVVAFQIVAADGKVYEFSEEKDPIEFKAAKTNLGLLGIVYTVTFRAQPMYNLYMVDTFPLAKDFLNPSTIKSLVESSDGIEVFYWPFNSFNIVSLQADPTKDKLWVKRWVRTDLPVNLTQTQLAAMAAAQTAATAQANQTFLALISSPSSLVQTPALTSAIFNQGPAAAPANYVLQVPDAIHYQAGIDNFLLNNIDISFKADKDFANVALEVQNVITKVYQYAALNKYPLNMAMEFRIIKSTNALLAPSFDEDPHQFYVFLEVETYGNTPGWQEFAIDFGQGLINRYGAKPHWAKEWEYLPNVTTYLSQAYHKNIEKFEKVRSKYDPKQIFFDNNSLKEIFFPSPQKSTY